MSKSSKATTDYTDRTDRVTHLFANGRNPNIEFRSDDQMMKTDQVSLVRALSLFRHWPVCALSPRSLVPAIRLIRVIRG
jgi:hypothetical protein